MITFYLTLQIKAQTVSDVDGSTYNTVTIGTQIWMKENLRTTKYSDGTPITNITNATWGALTTPAYCTYNNTTSADTINTYGRLYNWYVVNTGKLCPANWHVPTDAQWTTMENYLIANGYNYDGTTAGNKFAKALTSTTGWTSSTTEGAVGNNDFPAKRNTTGFTALPGGQRSSVGFDQLGIAGDWWSSTESNLGTIYRFMSFKDCGFWSNPSGHQTGKSVRCLSDNTSPTSMINLASTKIIYEIYPNPATDKLYLKNDNPSNATVIITDLQGKPVINKLMVSNYIDISNLSKGIYIVKIIESRNIATNKLIKE